MLGHESGSASAVSGRYVTLQAEQLQGAISETALQTIESAVRTGARALPRRGLEVGGLLLGTLKPALRIDSAHLVEIEHRFGPAFRLSPADRETFRAAIGGCDGQVIGHFRSQTKGEPGTSEDDDAIADLVNVPDPMLLLIRVSGSLLDEARVYRRTDGRWIEGFRSRQQPPRRLWAGLLAAALLLAVITTGLWLWRAPGPPAQPASERISLQVKREDKVLIVRWNPALSLLPDGNSGILTIKDGDSEHKVPLDRQGLQSGQIFYVPQSESVQFRLEIGSTQFMAAPVPSKTELGETQTASQPREGVVVELPAESTAAPSPPPAVKRDLAVMAARDPAPVKPAPVKKEPVFVPPVAAPPREAPTAVAAAVLPPPSLPAKDPTRTPARTFQPPVQPSPAPASPLPQPPPVVVTQPPASTQPPGAAPAPVQPLPPPVSFIAAVPIRRVSPAVPPHLRSVIRQTVSVEVKVAVDETGKVQSAVPLAASGEQKLLAAQAAQAALLWSFTPARRNGLPVGSEVVLTFRFERPAVR